MSNYNNISTRWTKFVNFVFDSADVEIAWETHVDSVIVHTAEIPATGEREIQPTVYKLKVYPLDQNDNGADKFVPKIGYNIIDYLGQVYEIVNIIGNYIYVSDYLLHRYCPPSGRPALVYKPAGRLECRTSGFEFIDDDNVTISLVGNVFSIAPSDVHRAFYNIYLQKGDSIYKFKIYSQHSVDFNAIDDTGLYVVYFKYDDSTEQPVLVCQKNSYQKTNYAINANVYTFYWNGTSNTLIYVGKNNHGSQWNPQIHWWANLAFNGIWKEGLDITNLLIGDGSLNSHAQAGIAQGTFMHEDMEHNIPAAYPSIPVMWFNGASKIPVVEMNPGYMFLRSSFLNYNSIGSGKVQCTDKYFMLYHVFATNCQLYPLISIMGTNQYENKNDCCKAALEELKAIKKIMPQETRLAVCSFAFEVNSEFANDVKARIVQPCTGQSSFIWIEENNNWYDILIQISIDESEVLTEMSVTGNGTTDNKIHFVNDEETPGNLKFYGTGDAAEPAKGFHPLYSKLVTQVAHGFSAKQAIRMNGGSYTLAQANNATNAQTAGVVVQVIDADHFRFQSEGFDNVNSWAEGEYFLSPATAGLIGFEPASYNIGEVRQSLGWGTDRGLKIEIDLGDEISEEAGGGLSTVITDMSVTGDGSEENPVTLVNDEETPVADSYYGTEDTGTKGYHPLPTEDVQQLSGATPTFDLSLGRGAVITLTADTTITFSNLKDNDTGHIEVKQDSTGGWELHFAGADIEIALNSYQAAAEVKLTSMAGSKDIVVYWYTGTVMNLAVIFNIQP